MSLKMVKPWTAVYNPTWRDLAAENNHGVHHFILHFADLEASCKYLIGRWMVLNVFLADIVLLTWSRFKVSATRADVSCRVVFTAHDQHWFIKTKMTGRQKLHQLVSYEPKRKLYILVVWQKHRPSFNKHFAAFYIQYTHVESSSPQLSIVHCRCDMIYRRWQ